MDERGNISLPSDIGATAMTEREICELFGVIAPTVRAGIKALCKSGVLKEYGIKRLIRLPERSYIEVYRFLRGGLRTVRFSSDGGFACHPQHLHSSTGTSVAPRWFHCSVSTSPHAAVTEY